MGDETLLSRGILLLLPVHVCVCVYETCISVYFIGQCRVNCRAAPQLVAAAADQSPSETIKKITAMFS